MKVSAEVEIACSLAAREAARRRHDLMTVEHLLYALLHDQGISRVVAKAGGNVELLKQQLERVFDEQFESVSAEQHVSPSPSRGFQRVIQRAALHVESSGKEELEAHNLLVAIFSEADSCPTGAVIAILDCARLAPPMYATRRRNPSLPTRSKSPSTKVSATTCDSIRRSSTSPSCSIVR